LLTGMKFETIEGDYKYLIKMPMDSVSEENVAHILKEVQEAEREFAQLTRTPIETMWLNELTVLDKEYDVYQQKRVQIQSGQVGVKKPETKKIIRKMAIVKK